VLLDVANIYPHANCARVRSFDELVDGLQAARF
jgi:hypothetical protein